MEYLLDPGPFCSRVPFVLGRDQFVECSRQRRRRACVLLAVLILLVILLMYLFEHKTQHIPLVAGVGGLLLGLAIATSGGATRRAGLEWDGYQMERQRLLQEGMSEESATKTVIRSYEKRQRSLIAENFGPLLFL
jgi:hypothetical protein